MAHLTGLFERGGAYYLRVVLPLHHPLLDRYKSGKVVSSLGRCSHREAIRLGTIKRAEILWGESFHPKRIDISTDINRCQGATPNAIKHVLLRDVYDLWVKASRRTADSIAACNRAVKIFEQHTHNPPLNQVTRSLGNEFRSFLQTLPTTPKTARDRLNWIKSLLKYAAQDLELIPKSPWVGLDIKSKTTASRQVWSTDWLQKLLSHAIWQNGQLPKDKKAGGLAAYWVPLLALYTGARCSELCQLLVQDIDTTGRVPLIKITDQGEEQHVKTTASVRTIPIHSELIRLGFLEYVSSQKSSRLWPNLPLRDGKPGSFFSQWFGNFRRSLNVPDTLVFHSFRHTVRTSLTRSNVPEPIIDRLLGHESQGSIGARVYTHPQIEQLTQAIETLETLNLPVIAKVG
jgi:integrase